MTSRSHLNPSHRFDSVRSPFARRVRAARRQPNNDGGFTLPELLVAMTLSGVLIAAISLAISVMLTATPEAEIRLAESKDITFLQTWVPVDLSSAINSYDNPDEADLENEMAAGEPSMSYNVPLAGTNVLTLVVPDLEADDYKIVSYRYVLSAGDWRLVRYLIKNPGTASESLSQVGVASEVKDPPIGSTWKPGEKPVHAFQITSRNQVVLRPIGENITVFFKSGNEFSTGGAGLSAERDLTPNDPVTLPDPTAPPSRCGGRVALVLDTSWSVPGFGGGNDMEDAAKSFIVSFQGTPTTLTVMGFDSMAYQIYPNLNGDRGHYIDLLNPSSDIENAQINISALPNVDTQYPGLTPEAYDFEEEYSYYLTPEGTGIGTGDRTIGWSKNRRSESGLERQYATNWEDALHAPFFTEGTATENGMQRPQTPETVVWITDGEPTTNRAEMFYEQNSTDYLGPAILAANAGRSTGARIIGVLVGPGGPALEQNVADVVGGNKWTGSVSDTGVVDLKNAVSADYFTGNFDELGDVLRSIMAAQCGGTVTVQKKVEGETASGQWTYKTNIGDSTLDLDLTSALTFDFTFDTGDTVRDVLILEEVRDGYTFSHAECSVGGVTLPEASIVQNPEGAAGVLLSIEPDQAVHCTMVSNPESET